MTSTIIQGAQGLAKVLGTSSLVPSPQAIVKVMRLISQRNAKLDQQAMLAFRDLIVDTGKIAGGLNRVITQSLDEAMEKIDERQHLALIDLLRQIDALNNSTNDSKSEAMKTAIKESFELRKKEIEAIGEVSKIAALSGGTALVVLAAFAGYKYSRPKTFWEQVFSLFG